MFVTVHDEDEICRFIDAQRQQAKNKDEKPLHSGAILAKAIRDLQAFKVLHGEILEVH